MFETELSILVVQMENGLWKRLNKDQHECSIPKSTKAGGQFVTQEMHLTFKIELATVTDNVLSSKDPS